MRVRFVVILSFSILVILVLSIFTSYTSIYNHQKLLEKELLKIGRVAENNVEIQKRLALYKVFSEKMVVETTRKVWFVFIIDFLLILGVFGIYVYGVRRPIVKLSKFVKSLYFDRSASELKMSEIGTEEVRVLIRAFNEMIEKLKKYEDTMGNIQKYRGWKEISRVLVHEINNILSPVQTYVEYLLDSKENFEKVALILKKLNEIKEILQRLREFSHFPDPTLRKQDVVPLLQEVVSEFRNVKFERCDPVILYIDQLLFKEIFRNLIKNAIESGEDVNVRVETIDENNFITIIVSDNGSGIPDNMVDKIFNPGFSTKKGGGNLGIGLSIVKSLVQEHNATISVESKLNEGTRFLVRFPKVEE